MAVDSECQNGMSNPVQFVRKTPLSSYVVALRPWSFTASMTPVTLGSCLAYKAIGTFNVWIFMTVCITALAVHAAGNLVNTYCDFMKGVDTPKSGDDRTLVDRILNPNDVATLGGVLYCIGCAGFVVLVIISPAPMEHLALIYFGGLSGSFLYTGGLGLKYIAMGDVAIFLTFGPITVLFAYMAQGGELCWLPMLYTVPLALNTMCILHANNTRDMESDKRAGIVTLAIMLGRGGSYVLFAFLLFVPYLMFGLLTLHFTKWFSLPWMTIFIALRFEKSFRSGDLTKLPTKQAKLNLLLGFLFVVSLTFAKKEDLPGF